ncbi:MAG: cold-shock protein [Alphaproteobacteria bacterium]
MSYNGIDDEPGDLREIEGVVKWFNTVKGFGFVTPSDGSNDAFLHLSVLRDAGFSTLQPGVTISCVVSSRSKGLQVTRILQVDESTAEPAPQQSSRNASHAAEPVGPASDFVDATVKWFNADKGYGFVCQVDKERDVFIHMVTLRRSGVRELEAGQTVKVRIAEGPKGPQATEIST